MKPQRAKRRVPLGPLLVGLAAIMVVCAGGAVFLIKTVGLLSKPEARIVGCKMEEHKVPFPNEAGFAQVGIEVTNRSSRDTVYVVGVVVKDVAGQVVGSAEHRVGVPSQRSRQETWRVTLTKQGGRDCEVTKLEEFDSA